VASAIAVTFSLLILAVMIGQYTSNVLPGQMQAVEYQHTLEVENEFSQMQADILAEASNPTLPISITAPLAMSSGGIPPLGLPAGSTLYALSSPSSETNVSYTEASVTPVTVVWAQGSNCTTTTAGACSRAVVAYNETANNATLNFQFTGCNSAAASCYMFYNLSGSYDALTVNVLYSGSRGPGILVLQVQGVHDQVSVSITGTGRGPTETVGVNALLEGGGNGFSASVPGTGLDSPIAINASFVLGQGGLCPSGNAYASTQFGGISLGPGTTDVQSTVSWFNNQGIQDSHFVAGDPTPGNSLTFLNQSMFTSCPFQQAHYSAPVNQSVIGGFADHLYNRYFPAVTVEFEEGAVLAGGPGNTSVMLSPPRYSVLSSANGPELNLTLIQPLVSTLSAQSGGGVVGVNLRLEGSSYFSQSPSGSARVAFPLNLSIVTPYPGAWIGFFDSVPSLFGLDQARVCHACSLGDPAGSFTVVAPVYVVGIELTTLSVAVNWN
jgi:hypothetical protein